jgi:fructose-bisphosphate aldolase class I
MNLDMMTATVHSLIGDGKGLLAMDESTGTCNKRFAPLGIPQNEEARRSYREMLITTAGLSESISGAILYDETIRQKTSRGERFVEVLTRAGIVPGIKVDIGAKPMSGFPGEKATEGLDGLPARVAEYVQAGARFAKWRAVIAIDADKGLPTQACIDANAHSLARYAGICQDGGLVPIIEPEVIMEGSHDLQQCLDVTMRVQHAVFNELHTQRIRVECLLLKPNMILPGSTCPNQSTLEDIAQSTIHCLLRSVPAAVPGIAFLSGGQSGELASARLNQMHLDFAGRLPWALTFSFARAIQNPALEIWAGQKANVPGAQKALLHRARCNQSARHGEYNAASDNQ